MDARESEGEEDARERSEPEHKCKNRRCKRKLQRKKASNE